MKRNLFTLGGALALIACTAACQKSSPAQPSTSVDTAPTTMRDARTGTTIIAAQPVSPAANASLSWGNQPISLTVTNAVSSGRTALTYTFEVATDAAFTQIKFSKSGVAQGTGTQTSATTAGTTLAGITTYYWRVRVYSGSTVGPNSAVRSFSLGAQIVLGTPTLASPGNGGTAIAPLTLTANNVTRSGPNGQLTYRFQVSTTSSFGSLVFDGTAPEVTGTTTTSIVVNATGITQGLTYFWRVQVSDTANGITTAFSSTFSFVAQLFDMRTAAIFNSPLDLGSWPETSRVTSIIWDPNGILVDFDKRTGPNRWPDVPFAPGSSDTLQYTLGMCLNVDGHGGWACSAAIQFWYGRMDADPTSGGQPALFSHQWFYDARWGTLSGYQPAEGEIVGVFAGSGNLRNITSFTQATCPNVCERTNVALVPFHTDGTGYSLSSVGSRVTLRGK